MQLFTVTDAKVGLIIDFPFIPNSTGIYQCPSKFSFVLVRVKLDLEFFGQSEETKETHANTGTTY